MDAIARIPPLRMDRSRQAAPQVFEALRELIVAIELPPGTVLPRAELADRYGVSQTPVRDALMKLGEEGLVDIYPQHATVVSRIDVGAAMRAHFLRRALELEIVRDLAGGDAARLAPLLPALREQIARQVRALAAQEYAAFTLADREFHRHMYDAAGMGDLFQLIRQRSGHVDRLRRLHLPAKGKAQAVVRDHKAIVDAIEAREPDEAQAALRKHLAGTLTFVDEVRRRHPDWVIG
jgi:GntR family transcriptional regulator, rspAB operon transcriptional repressor